MSPTELRADCSRCAGLCCVAPAFAASADFAIDKPAGVPCPNLAGDARCGIHPVLRERGFAGCTVFDCFGAGQLLTQHTFAGRTWQEAPEQFSLFPVVRQLQELRWYLTEALAYPAVAALHPRTQAALDEVTAQVTGDAATLAAVDVPLLRGEVGGLLGEVSEQVRVGVPGRGRDRRGADLIGRDLRRTTLRGASLRGAHLLGADLRGADLTATDLLGADLRAADLRGAELSTALFLTQPQADAARGDAATRLPARLTRPTHWS
ncbi:pentapeptide repeat-containing protein [Modestobacter sp. I12A-02628]|uniref:Pentapeptide repeat-containing protein n=1 Tax=Goekera deserti TaxID=2497753 RepID=A0A7K3WJR0_9ACTN|nr:pentapeptide repeat-containing protein [Goekera deserti]MPQ97284.1 pentapeptide repeat-containing protein [Goekera deserti]NDI50205.1 pentapeptide repeat-containing protein [Goekera deserti]NEL55773.1 pentapeptide repeat-containing protein [Goekera deserti]